MDRRGPLVGAALFWAFAACAVESAGSGAELIKPYASVTMEYGTLPELGDRKRPEFLLSLDVVKKAMRRKQPALLFFYVMATAAEKNETLKSASAASKEMDDKLFSGAKASWPVGLYAKFFLAGRYEVTNISKDKNPFFNYEKAPLVVIVGADGKELAALPEASCNPDSLSRAMGKALTAIGYDVAQIRGRLTKEMPKLASLEEKRYAAEKEFRELQDKWSRSKGPDAGALQKAVQKAKSELARLNEEIKTLKAAIEEPPLLPVEPVKPKAPEQPEQPAQPAP